MNTTGSKGHDCQIVSRRTTEKVVQDKKQLVKQGYCKHKKRIILSD